MREKTYFRVLLALVVGMLTFTALINYRLDAYGIFRSDYEKQVLEPNKNYVKTKYVLDNKEKYQSFLFGSSKVGHIETDFIEETSLYNMCYSEGIPADWLDTIQTFLKNGVQIDTVLLGLDEFSFTIDPESHAHDLLRLRYSQLDWFQKMKYYILRNPFDVYNFRTVQSMIRQDPYYLMLDDLWNTGITYGNDEYVEANWETIKDSPAYNKPIDFYQKDRVDETIEDIRQILNLCRENKIEVILFFNPVHHATYALHEDITNKAKEQLMEITSYWDFSGYNSITTDNFYWYETSHFRHNVGRMMLERIFALDCGVPIPDDFGVYVEQIEY